MLGCCFTHFKIRVLRQVLRACLPHLAIGFDTNDGIAVLQKRLGAESSAATDVSQDVRRRKTACSLQRLDDLAPVVRPVLNVIIDAVGKARLGIAKLFRYRCYLIVGMAASRTSDSASPTTRAIAAAIRQIPRGRVSTYGAVAKAAGYPRCARNVSKVLNQIKGLPWQRVLGSGGSISLPGELGLEQRFLLQAEGVKFRGRKVDLKTCGYEFPKRPRSAGARVPKK